MKWVLRLHKVWILQVLKKGMVTIMRITNKMMTNNMMSNINKNKLYMSKLEQQYSTGKKIQRPSEDPIIAVRALKLRTNLSELEQYHEKNIPDAMSWMDVTEAALTTVNSLLRQINTYCVQGSTDTLTAKDRSAIVQNLEEMKSQIYHEGNTNYAGRYVFTGYKTDSSLIFDNDRTDLSYDITEQQTGEQIEFGRSVVGSYGVEDFEDATEDFSAAPQLVEYHRIQLSYDKLNGGSFGGLGYIASEDNNDPETAFPAANIVTTSLDDDTLNHYEPDADAIHFIPETGELILGDNAYNQLKNVDKINITYTKDSFKEGDLKPEHYFDCVLTDPAKADPITFERPERKQEIQYEVNYNQKLTVNTEGAESIKHKMGRDIDEILNAVNDVVATEEKIAHIDERLKDSNLPEADRKRYEQMLEQLDTELELKKEIMQEAFEKGNTTSSVEQNRVNMALADLGSRYVRLELTESRLSSQKVDFEELLSSNEDVDMVDTVIKYGSAEVVYNASLNAASRVVQNTLLDFLR